MWFVTVVEKSYFPHVESYIYIRLWLLLQYGNKKCTCSFLLCKPIPPTFCALQSEYWCFRQINWEHHQIWSISPIQLINGSEKNDPSSPNELNVAVKWTASLFRSGGSRLWTRTAILIFVTSTIPPPYFGLAGYRITFPRHHSRCMLPFHVIRVYLMQQRNKL